MATYPLPTLAAQVTATGISAPQYNDILESLKASARLIFGADTYLEEDGQDGQMFAIIARAIHDSNQAAIAVYNSYSPQSAQGEGLSNAVKINHIARRSATNSQVPVVIIGQTGTIISAGVVADELGNKWNLPPTVTIPLSGTVTVTATAQEAGAVTAQSGSVTKIVTPVAGWQTVNNVLPSTTGQAVESDAELRARQEITPALNAKTVLDGLAANLMAIPGVTYGKIYENDTDSTNADGLPEHSIGVVIQGGDLDAIAQTIYARKAPGVATFGTTTKQVPDVSGALRDIKFSVPVEQIIYVTVTLTPGDTYTSQSGDNIKAAVVNYINERLQIGEDVVVNRLYTPALLGGLDESYQIQSITAGLTVGSTNTANIVIGLTEKAVCQIEAVDINLA